MSKYEHLWTRLWVETLATQRPFFDYSSEALRWLVDQLLVFGSQAAPEKLYRVLTLLNRTTRWGRMALTFNYFVFVYTQLRDSTKLQAYLKDAPFPELQSTSFTEENRHLIKSEIERTTITLNMLVDTYSRTDILPESLLKSAEYSRCEGNVCSVFKVDFSFDGDYQIKVVDGMYVWSFHLPHLLILLARNDLNPYTHQPFSESVRTNVLQKYGLEYLIAKEYTSYLEGIISGKIQP